MSNRAPNSSSVTSASRAPAFPSRRRGIAQLWIHADYREIENLILPLASDGTNVDILMVSTKLFRYAPARQT